MLVKIKFEKYIEGEIKITLYYYFFYDTLSFQLTSNITFEIVCVCLKEVCVHIKKKRYWYDELTAFLITR